MSNTNFLIGSAMLLLACTTPPTFAQTSATQPQAPKHLFQLIFRYEGDGVIDANWAKLKNLNLLPINRYSSDPMVRMEQQLIDSENLRQAHDEWRRFWMHDQPAHLAPYRIEVSGKKMPLAD